MPLDTSAYSLALLRLDGRRWNELRRLHGQMSTQAAADGSSYVEMGNTKVMCTVEGPVEGRRGGGPAPGASSVGGSDAEVKVEISLAGFSGVDRRRTSRNDKRIAEMQATMASTFAHALFTHLYPHSTIQVRVHVLAQDGSLLAACVNAATLALVDAGIPMADYVAACTAGSTSSYSSGAEKADPLLDLNGLEEQELPFLTLATMGEGAGGGDEDVEMEDATVGAENVCALVMDTRVQVGRLEGMLASGVDGCRQIRALLDEIVRAHGKKMVKGAALRA